jgi:ribosomal-protein-alanine N-acetyltransferase
MRLETERLLIRDWKIEDAEAAFAIYGDPEVMRYVGPMMQSLEQARASLGRIIARHEGKPLGFWAAETREGSELVGGALLNYMEQGQDIEVGYHLAKKWWGHGLATELATALVRYGFGELQLDKIVGVTYPDNIPSRRVLEKSGLLHLGSAKYVDIDVEMYSLNRSNWTGRS